MDSIHNMVEFNHQDGKHIL